MSLEMIEALKTSGAVIGGIAGIIALGWRVVDEFGSFLRISLKVEPPLDGWTSALTVVDNKGLRAKEVSYALLLIGPEVENPVDTVRLLAHQFRLELIVRSTNALEHFSASSALMLADRSLIPLPYYYSENIRIADETLTYRAQIDLRSFPQEVPYSVRFYIFCEGRLHRSTHDSFVVGRRAGTASVQSDA